MNIVDEVKVFVADLFLDDWKFRFFLYNVKGSIFLGFSMEVSDLSL